jgi:hypothetical protein
MKIQKHFKTLKQVEKFQSKLYNQYNTVKLIFFPVCSESGIYTFFVN